MLFDCFIILVIILLFMRGSGYINIVFYIEFVEKLLMIFSFEPCSSCVSFSLGSLLMMFAVIFEFSIYVIVVKCSLWGATSLGRQAIPWAPSSSLG